MKLLKILQPSEHPSVSIWPTSQPSSAPSDEPSSQPSAVPSTQPSSLPSEGPSSQPSVIPSAQPSSEPSRQPSAEPSKQPSEIPSTQPSKSPSAEPSISGSPSSQPSSIPSMLPSISTSPSSQPSSIPSTQPSSQPSATPSVIPSSQPSDGPSAYPSQGCGNIQNDCGWGILNPWTCRCDCPAGICLDDNLQCYIPCQETIDRNPFAGCLPGWDCPWFPDQENGFCKSKEHQPNEFEIYRTTKECCDEHFGGSADCMTKSDHRPFQPLEAVNWWGTDVGNSAKWFPDLFNKKN
ncbi:hypothetical protein THAOC_09158, partial [Thalassiosira oceanica]